MKFKVYCFQNKHVVYLITARTLKFDLGVQDLI